VLPPKSPLDLSSVATAACVISPVSFYFIALMSFRSVSPVCVCVCVCVFVSLCVKHFAQMRRIVMFKPEGFQTVPTFLRDFVPKQTKFLYAFVPFQALKFYNRKWDNQFRSIILGLNPQPNYFGTKSPA
jgi:hypothetical protein